MNTLASKAWLVVALLWPVALLNYLDRQLISTMKRSIVGDIPSISTEEDFGRIMGMFLLVYACLSPVGGYLADRFNRRWAVIGSLGVWSAVTFLTGRVRNLDEMLWVRAAMGVSEACYIPAALALIADFHSGSTRSRAVGIHQTGIYAGMALGGFGGYIAETSSWRNGFYGFGLAGVVYAVLLIFALPRPPAESSNASNSLEVLSALKSVLRIGSFWLLVVYFTLPAMSGWVMKNWLPSVLADAFHLGQGSAGLTGALYITLASAGGTLLGGMVADLWMRRTARGRIYTSALGLVILVPALLGAGQARTLSMAVCFLILYGIGWGFFDSNNMPILCQIVRPELRATGYGLMNMVSTGTGAWVTLRMGILRDRGTPLFVIFGFLAAAAAISTALILSVRLPQKACGLVSDVNEEA